MYTMLKKPATVLEINFIRGEMTITSKILK